MNTLEAISERFSYRGKYKNIKVPRENLQVIMKAGLDAPSGCNKQTTSLIAVDDEKILQKIYDVIPYNIGKTAPAVVCVMTKIIKAYGGKSYNVQDYSAAIENMLLACVELGYASCWFEGCITDENNIAGKIAKILYVPDEYEIVCFLPIGVPLENVNKVKKKIYSERAWFNKYKNNR